MRVAVAAALLVLAACAALPSRTAANKISINWKPNTNYSDWVKQHSPFYKDDWLGTPPPRIASLSFSSASTPHSQI
jgi:hypothetical protein